MNDFSYATRQDDTTRRPFLPWEQTAKPPTKQFRPLATIL